MHRNREAAITKITDDLFRGARVILAIVNSGESVTESLVRTYSVRYNQSVYSEKDTTLFFPIFGLDNGDQFSAMKGKDRIDGPLIKAFIAEHPIYQNQGVIE